MIYKIPSGCQRLSNIFGIGQGLLTKHLFKYLKSDTNPTIPFFLGIMNVGVTVTES